MKLPIIYIVLLTFGFGCANSQDWPDWRGANRDGTWNETGIIEKFDSETIKTKWSVPIGSGYCGPTVSNGKVYLSDLLVKPSQTEGVLCFNEKTGEKIWEFRYECIYEGVGYPAGPRASVIINDDKAYSLGTMGNLFCFNAENGEVLWQKNLNKEYEIQMPTWGIASTPLIIDDKIIIHVSGSKNAGVVAFNKNSGEEIWRNLDDRAGYSAPILIEKMDKSVVVNWTEHSLSGLNPETGEVFWRFPWKTGSGMSIATPVLYNDHIFVSAFYSGSLLIKLGEDYTTAEKVWQRSGESERKTDALHCVMNTPVIIDDFIYGVDSYGELRCLEFETGDRIWEDQTAVNRARWANIHFVQNKDKIWMFNEQGELIISKLSPQGFTEISRAKLIEPSKKQHPRGVVWTHPTFANKHVFVRNDNQLICADLSKK
ncbi:MAG: PQQ-binding-like beta-propeller repeat protein [Prolixibacteraceae bacterium]|jgi:outer membrane protein assembly factor BamB|nr:PQQ-binding-like beta-propeller repeat protein [Prolixibacteraceae bacterium]MBT6006769.1 PQQ-binding-like beta-propeller repeat protein [Prolixibacteraceae bacterium]MBT6766902.1 PQQ-binding-like beta-propeller repeat protein [Prolixibacteraceae bacterium]MBT7000281.1 PQQ-binding-like beta-propeller repeat protein [Prolixibacteraceae bacterium]MBT7394020.1 PQQ-binding-like beta-propeller repeat protein [Prolixibacteraceae bacterium]